MISNVYSYYMQEYGLRPYNRQSTHKKSELRDVYNSIVKLDRSNPFYKIDASEESQKLAIDIKENARSLSDITNELTDAANGNMTYKSVAETNSPDVLDVEYIGENKAAGTSHQFTVDVKQLATPQINTGNFLSPNARGLYSGSYSFDADIGNLSYELNFNVKDGENNLDIQNKLSRLVNNSNIGLKASVLQNSEGKTALVLQSNATGVGDKPVIFKISDDNTKALNGSVELFGLNNTSHYPSNAVFDLNGDTKISSSNSFTVDREFEITLKDVSNGQPATVGLKQNTDALIDSLHELADSYNSISSLAKSGNSAGSRRLYSDLAYIASLHQDVLNSNGLQVTENGVLEVDDNRLKQLSDHGDLLNTLSQLGKFKNALQYKSKAIMINPMDYINKSIISYKNPARPSGDPYTTSIYSGMMYNGYY